MEEWRINIGVLVRGFFTSNVSLYARVLTRSEQSTKFVNVR